MSFKNHRILPAAALALLGALRFSGAAEPPAGSTNLWDHGNLIAWCVAPPWDAKARGPEARAEMLEKLGFKMYAYNWRDPAIPTFDAEIDAVQSRGIKLVGWALYGSENPAIGAILAAFERHHIHPQLWLMETASTAAAAGGAPRLPPEKKKLSPEERDLQTVRTWRETIPRTPEERERRINEEADRIQSLVKRVAPYGSKVEFYNHNSWLGLMENQLAVIERLKTLGVNDVGIVYNFSHARDQLHDDSVDFPALWRRIQPYVVAVNIGGMRIDLKPRIYPSQGDRELEMMRTIEQSGWRGPIGVIAENGGDAEVTLTNDLKGLDWLAAELREPGSGGPPPFPSVR